MHSSLGMGGTAPSRVVLGILACLLTFVASPGSAKAQGAAKAPAASGEVGLLRRRVEQLEEQLVDIQVTIGTLETLARSGTQGGVGQVAAPVAGGQLTQAPATQSGEQAARIAALETQIRALTAQVEQLSRPGAPNTAREQGATQQFANQQATAAWQGNSNNPPAAGNPLTAPQNPRFGSTTVEPGSSDRIGNFLQQDRTATLDTGRLPPVSGDDPQQKYEAAYGLLLQQEYGAAQQAFADFVGKFSKHPLAGNAQYWLGETYYVRGNTKMRQGRFWPATASLPPVLRHPTACSSWQCRLTVSDRNRRHVLLSVNSARSFPVRRRTSSGARCRSSVASDASECRM